MKIECIDEMRLTQADDAAIAALLDRAFQSIDYNGRSYFQNRHHLRVVARQDDAIIGHIALSFRAIRMDDQLVQAAGIAEVATDPAHRGKGIATALLATAITSAKSSLAEVAVLFGDEPFYAAAGFAPKPNHTLTISMHETRTGVQENRSDDGLMVLALTDITWDDEALIDLVGFAF